MQVTGAPDRGGWRERATAVGHSLRFAARALRHAPGWTTSVVGTLAIGIGLATAVYTIADAVLIRALPVRAPDQIVVLWGAAPDGTDHFPFLYRDALEYARRTQTLRDVAFFSYGGAQPVPMDLDVGTVQLRRSLVSGNFFAFLGAAPLLGRTLRPDDDVRGAAPVAVLSYAAWQRLFGGDASAVGRRIVLHYDGTTYAIVGVMPRALDYPQGVDFWTPVVPNSGPLGDQPIYAELNTLGRLRRGASIAAVETELSRFFAVKVPTWHLRGVAHFLTDDVVGNVGPAVLAFGAAAALLLLITCINVANLLLVRGLARIREFAVRKALGAGRGRLLGQLLTEGILLAACGGIVGAGLAVASVRAFVAIAPANTPRLTEIHVGGATIAAAVAITTVSLLLFAVPPSLTASRVDVQDALRSGSQQSGGNRRYGRGAQVLVVAQMAIAIVVLCAAGLVARSLASLSRVPVALDPPHLLVIELAFPKRYMGDATAVNQVVTELSTRIASMSGIRAVVPVFTRPFASVGGVFGRIAAEGQSAGETSRNPVVDYELATPNEFAVFGIPLVRGRAFASSDRAGTPSVAIVSQSLAQHYWPNADPIGKRLVRGPHDLLNIIGVVSDTYYRDLRNPRPRVYLPIAQSPFPIAPTTLVISTARDPSTIVPILRHIVSEAEPGVVVASATPFETYVGDALAQPRLNALLLGLFATAAVLLAAVGLFGVMATMVRQRARELSLRLALGATPAALRLGILSRASAIACTGLIIGLTASLVVTRAVQSLLFGVNPTDPVTLGASAVLLLAIALVAALLPALRAERVDPAAVLRAE